MRRKCVNWTFNPRTFDCKSNKATASTRVNWMNNRKQGERCVTDFYIRLLPLRHKHSELPFVKIIHTRTHTHKIISPPPPVLWAGGGGRVWVWVRVRGRLWEQPEVTQVALLRFHLFGCERDRDPGQTRPDQTGRDHMAALKAFNGTPSNWPGKEEKLNKTLHVMTAVCFCSHHLQTHTGNHTAALHRTPRPGNREREKKRENPAMIEGRDKRRNWRNMEGGAGGSGGQ